VALGDVGSERDEEGLDPNEEKTIGEQLRGIVVKFAIYWTPGD
jgi:hypothetical protein